MTTSNHGRRPLARIALAAGGIGSLIAVAAAAHAVAGLIGGARGALAGFLVIAAAFGGCGLAHGLHTFRTGGLTRPALVRPPVPAGDLEPANSLS